MAVALPKHDLFVIIKKVVIFIKFFTDILLCTVQMAQPQTLMA